MLVDFQAQITQMNHYWSETLARFLYELRKQQNMRTQLSRLLQIIVFETVNYPFSSSSMLKMDANSIETE